MELPVYIKKLKRKILSFLFAGFVGFCVDALIFFACTLYFGASYIWSRIVASLVAIFATWLLNRRHTFAEGRVDPIALELLRYVGASSLGAVANLFVLALIAPHDSSLHHVPAYIGGTIAGMVVNYLAYDRLVFRGRFTPPTKPPSVPESNP